MPLSESANPKVEVRKWFMDDEVIRSRALLMVTLGLESLSPNWVGKNELGTELCIFLGEICVAP